MVLVYKIGGRGLLMGKFFFKLELVWNVYNLRICEVMWKSVWWKCFVE